MAVYRRPTSALWWCEFTVAGRRYQLPTGQTERKDAQREARRLRSEAEQKTPVRRRGVKTLKTLAADDINRARLEGAVPTWIARLENIWVLLLAHYGDCDPIDIDHGPYVRQRKEAGIKNQTLRRELQALLRALTVAKIPVADWPKLKDEPKGKTAGKLHSPDTVSYVIANLPPMAVDGVVFAAVTGLRLHELWRVRADFVSGDSITLPADATKGKKSRTLGLNEDALEIVQRVKAFREYGYGQALRRTCQRIGISPTVTMRDLRHCYASNGLKASGNLSAVSSALGHTELETTTIYLHARREDVIELGVKTPTPGSLHLARQPNRVRVSKRIIKEKAVESKGIEPSTSGLQSPSNVDFIDLEPLSYAEIVQSFPEPSKQDPYTKSLHFEWPRVFLCCLECGKSADVEQGPGMGECLYCGSSRTYRI